MAEVKPKRGPGRPPKNSSDESKEQAAVKRNPVLFASIILSLSLIVVAAMFVYGGEFEGICIGCSEPSPEVDAEATTIALQNELSTVEAEAANLMQRAIQTMESVAVAQSAQANAIVDLAEELDRPTPTRTLTPRPTATQRVVPTATNESLSIFTGRINLNPEFERVAMLEVLGNSNQGTIFEATAAGIYQFRYTEGAYATSANRNDWLTALRVFHNREIAWLSNEALSADPDYVLANYGYAPSAIRAQEKAVGGEPLVVELAAGDSLIFVVVDGRRQYEDNPGTMLVEVLRKIGDVELALPCETIPNRHVSIGKNLEANTFVAASGGERKVFSHCPSANWFKYDLLAVDDELERVDLVCAAVSTDISDLFVRVATDELLPHYRSGIIDRGEHCRVDFTIKDIHAEQMGVLIKKAVPVSEVPEPFVSDFGIPSGASYQVTVNPGEIHIFNGGPMCLLDICLEGGITRGSVIAMQSKTESYTVNLTGLVPFNNGHTAYIATPDQWNALIEGAVEGLKKPDNCTNGQGCEEIDLVVIHAGQIALQERR